MQWLFDIVLDMVWKDIYNKGIFRDRGDPDGWDFTPPDFTIDGAWHDLDLSGIIPENTKAISVLVEAESAEIGVFGWFRKKGNANTYNRGDIRILIANVTDTREMILIPNSDRIIQYQITPVEWAAFNFVVKGWWF